jgi:probable HAF family extracellular repeat protein
VRNRIPHRAIPAALAAILVAVVFSPSVLAQDYSTASAISDGGQIVGGTFLDDQSAFDAFTLDSRGHATDLGTLGGFASLAFAVNNRGDVVGQADTPEVDALGEAISVAFLVDGAGLHSLGSLPGLPNSQALSINNKGVIAGRSYGAGEDQDLRAFVWDRGAMRDIGTLGGTSAEAFGINDAGSIAGDSTTAGGARHAFVYEKGLMRDLGTLGGSLSRALSINNGGQVVGFSSLANGERHAFVTGGKGGALRDLGTLGGGFSRAEFINNRGEIVGQSTTADGDVHAFLYSQGKMIDLGTLGGFYSAAFNTNARGDIVGESDTADGDTHAFLVHDGVMIDLDAELPQ